MSDHNYTISTTLEKLDRKPALWKGLTIDELLLVVSICFFGGTIALTIIFSLFDYGAVGMMLGFISSLGTTPLVAGVIENQKKKYGADMLWVTLKTNIQRRGLWRFSGLMTDKVRWDIRFSKAKSTEYLGPKN